MVASESFYDELARLQQAPGRDRLESVVSHLRSRKDAPWPTCRLDLEGNDLSGEILEQVLARDP